MDPWTLLTVAEGAVDHGPPHKKVSSSLVVQGKPNVSPLMKGGPSLVFLDNARPESGKVAVELEADPGDLGGCAPSIASAATEHQSATVASCAVVIGA